MTRQAYYQHSWKQQEVAIEEDIILQLVDSIREYQPNIGGRKLFHMIKGDLMSHEIKMGRDAFFNLLSRNNLLVKRRKYRPRTTNSNHHYKRYPNIVKGLYLERPNQLWVSDITYISVNDGHVYLSLITDAYSKKIVGYYVSANMQTINNVKALKIALRHRSGESSLIHHSDRGSQYCSQEYTDLLKSEGILISMTESGDPRDNAIAERVNGIVKNELMSHIKLTGLRDTKDQVSISVAIYNQLRPHLSLDYYTPDEVHIGKHAIKKRWKSYYRNQEKVKLVNGFQDN